MPAPKKHTKRPATAKAKRKAGWARTIGMTLSDETLSQLDDLGKHHGIEGRSAVVRFLANEAFRKLGEALGRSK